MEEINTHNLIIDFGKHKGVAWTKVPISYISWMANQKEVSQNVLIARAEQKRRGTSYPNIEISGHAIDRASLHCRKIWHETALTPEEGLNSWLIRMSNEARQANVIKNGKYCYKGMKFAFEEGEFYPSLKTVMRD